MEGSPLKINYEADSAREGYLTLQKLVQEQELLFIEFRAQVSVELDETGRKHLGKEGEGIARALFYIAPHIKYADRADRHELQNCLPPFDNVLLSIDDCVQALRVASNASGRVLTGRYGDLYLKESPQPTANSTSRRPPDPLEVHKSLFSEVIKISKDNIKRQLRAEIDYLRQINSIGNDHFGQNGELIAHILYALYPAINEQVNLTQQYRLDQIHPMTIPIDSDSVNLYASALQIAADVENVVLIAQGNNQLLVIIPDSRTEDAVEYWQDSVKQRNTG